MDSREDDPQGVRKLRSDPHEAGSLRRLGRAHILERYLEARRTIRWLRLGLAAAAGLALVVALVAALLLRAERLELMELRGQLAAGTRRLSDVEQEMKQLRRDADLLVRGRLPGLEPIFFDRVLKIEDRYVRNMLFTVVRRHDERHYEYQMVIENPSDSLLTPNVRLYLFDRFGVQLGVAQIASSYKITEADIITLSPHEVRSFSAEIPLNRPGVEPHYYLLNVE